MDWSNVMWLVKEYAYAGILIGIPIIGIIASVVWIYKDHGIRGILKFVAAVALVSIVASCLPKLWH